MQRLSAVEIERTIDISVVQAANGFNDVKKLAEYAKNKNSARFMRCPPGFQR